LKLLTSADKIGTGDALAVAVQMPSALLVDISGIFSFDIGFVLL
jgi:hypothetical protein